MSQFESAFEEKFYNERRAKLEQIAALGQPAYPNTFRALSESYGTDVPTLLPLGLNPDNSPKPAEQLESEHIAAAVAGRIVAIRLQGKAGFATLQQGGQRLQIYVRKDDVGDTLFDLYKLLDLGDHIGVTGHLMRTRTGELTLKAASLNAETPALTFLAKAMLPLPDKFSGLGDIELRYRRRYLDLFTDTGDDEPARRPAREVFLKRAAILRSIRNFFDTRGYLEVETPMLHTVAGGAAARKFTTHHNAEDMELTLRIAPELHLKRLVVGGLDRVYEINRNFRNEGVDTTHNPEFTMLEFYQAYANYHDLMDLTQELVAQVAQDVNGTTITRFNGHEIDLSQWRRLSMREAIRSFWPIHILVPPPTWNDFSNEIRFRELLQKTADNLTLIIEDESYEIKQKITSSSGHSVYSEMASFADMIDCLQLSQSLGKLIAAVFEFLSEPHLIQPTIIYDFPLAVSPLSKIKPDEPEWTERFEFYIGGFEVGNAFSELNDPDDQRKRFLAQLEDKARGDDEAMPLDEDYVRALGYGLPPTAGEGIGIDRLTMLLTGSRSIRDVILFPLMRPRPTNPEPETPNPKPAA